MAAQPRAFGFCFNPISVFWVWPERRRAVRRSSRCTTPTATGTPTSSTPTSAAAPRRPSRCTSRRSTAPTAPTTSPSRCPSDELLISVNLTTDDGATFNASLTGHRSDTSAVRAAPAALRGALLIRAHGIWLWLRRLPIRPRPDHHQEGVR